MDLCLIQFRPAYEVLAYCAFGGAPLAKLTVENVAHPTVLAAPQLPCLRINHEQFISAPFIFDYLRKNVADLDAGLSTHLSAELRAFSALIRVELQQAIEIARYDDEEHWWKVTYPQLVKTMPWPFNRLVARKLRHEKLLALEHVPGRRGERLNNWAVESCKTGYKALSERLGDGNWLLNTAGPTSVDALLFGHIAQAKFEPGLSDVLSEYPNLVTFFERSLRKINKSKFFSYGAGSGFAGPHLDLQLKSTIPSSISRIPLKKHVESSHKSPSGEESSVPKEGSWQAIGFALFTVVAYIGWNQMIAIREAGDMDDDDLDEDDQ